MLSKSCVLLSLAVVPGVAQPVMFGVRAGAALTDFFSFEPNHYAGFDFVNNNKGYVLGPTFELRLPFGFGFDVDALYRHGAFRLAEINGFTWSGSANSWQFPLLVKYRFPTKAIRPYADAGFAFDKLTGVSEDVVQSSGNVALPAHAGSRVGKGLVFGAGLDIHAVLHFSPELRFTRWGGSQYQDAYYDRVRASRNQAEFLLGITF
jgi:hypothetical protein